MLSVSTYHSYDGVSESSRLTPWTVPLNFSQPPLPARKATGIPFIRDTPRCGDSTFHSSRQLPQSRSTPHVWFALTSSSSSSGRAPLSSSPVASLVLLSPAHCRVAAGGDSGN